MPKIASGRARSAFGGREAAGFSGTVTLPLAQDRGAQAAWDVDLFKQAFAARVAPLRIRANRQACKSITCLDNIPGSSQSDDRLVNARPACCQAVVDIDEPMYALSKIFAMGEHDAVHGHHHVHGACAAEPWMAIGTAAAACVGVWYGVRNLQASRQTGAVIERMLGRIGQRRARDAARWMRQGAPPHDQTKAQRPSAEDAPLRAPEARRQWKTWSLPQRQALRNDYARIRCLRHAADTRRFAQWHGGHLQIANGALLLASVALPVLAPVATLGMMIFCGLQAERYVRLWRLPGTDTAGAGAGTGDAMARRHPGVSKGVSAFKQRLAARRTAFGRGAVAHGLYGLGAGLLTLATVVTGCSILLWPGLVCLALGMVAVGLTSKTCADHTYTSNSDTDLGSDGLGGKAAMFRQLRLLRKEGDLASQTAASVGRHDGRLKRWVRASVVTLGSWLGFEDRARAWSHRKRVATFAAGDGKWFARHVVRASKTRTKVLEEEKAALLDKVSRSKHRDDAAFLQKTAGFVGAWIATEDAWQKMCEDEASDAHTMATVAMQWLASRRWQEEVVGSLYRSTSRSDHQSQPWWTVNASTSTDATNQEEPLFNAALWLARLQDQDPDAQRVWNDLLAVMADFFAYRQVEVTRDRIDAMAQHVAARFAQKQSQA